MPRVCFKPVTWYIEMRHVRTFFSVWRHSFFLLRDVHSRRVYLQEEILPCFLSAIELLAWPLLSAEDKIWSGQIRSGFLDAFDTIKRAVSFPLEDKHVVNEHAFDTIKRAVSFPLEDKHVVNEHHVIRKSHDATQKKMSSLAASKTLLWTRQKNSWVSWSTGKSNKDEGKNQKKWNYSSKKIKEAMHILW